jgi:hypothetical protein
MTKSSANAKIHKLSKEGLEQSSWVGKSLGRSKSHTKEKMITNKSGDKMLPSNSPSETMNGRERKLPMRNLEHICSNM